MSAQNNNQPLNLNITSLKAETITADHIGVTNSADGQRTFALSDFEGKQMYVVNADKMSLVDTVPLDGSNPYPIDLAYDKLFVSTRGASSVDIVDVYSHKKLSTISLQHTPRSSTFNDRNYMAIAGGDKAYVTIVDVENLSIVGVYGPGDTTAPVDFGGSLRNGHPNWLDSKRFIMCDRANRKLRLFDVQQQAEISNIDTPTSAHHVLADSAGYFYAICEGKQTATAIYPGIMRFKIDADGSFVSSAGDYMEFNYVGSDATTMGCHHMLFINGNRIAACSTEGVIFIIDRDAADWGNFQTCVTNGSAFVVDLADSNYDAAGAGHFTPLVPRVLDGFSETTYPYNRGFSINHKNGTVSLLDTDPSGPSLIHTIQIDDQPPDAGRINIGHTSWFSRDGTKFYCVASRRGELVELDTSTSLDGGSSQDRITKRLLLTESVASSYIPQGTGWDGYAKIAYSYKQTEVM